MNEDKDCGHGMCEDHFYQDQDRGCLVYDPCPECGVVDSDEPCWRCE